MFVMIKDTDAFHIATIFDPSTNTYEVEVDGQTLESFTKKEEATSYSELLAFVFDVGYETKEKDYQTITEDDVYFPFELPDNARFINRFAGDGEVF